MIESDRLIGAIEAARAKLSNTFRPKPDNLIGTPGYEGMAQAAGVANFVLTALIEELKKPDKNLDQSTWGNNHGKSYL